MSEPERPPRGRRLARTFSPARFTEYRSLLRTAIGHGYALVSLEQFLTDPEVRRGQRVLILRHDVDQHPASALAISAIERQHGARSTWYLRWRTADPQVITRLRADGGEIGLHYETLTRRALALKLGPDADVAELLPACRLELRDELAAFARLFGPVRSIAAHGDSRIPWVRNLALVDGAGHLDLDVYDANLEMRKHRLGHWLTDRTLSEGAWEDGVRPHDLFAAGVSPIQCLVHPNNWTSGAAAWRDRVLRATLPGLKPGVVAHVGRTRSDTPGRR